MEKWKRYLDAADRLRSPMPKVQLVSSLNSRIAFNQKKEAMIYDNSW